MWPELLFLVIIVIILLKYTRAVEKFGASEAEYTIYYSNTCGYCRKALALLREKNLTFDPIELTEDNTAAIFARIPKTHKTKPVIFRRGVFLGGYTELVAYLQLKSK